MMETIKKHFVSNGMSEKQASLEIGEMEETELIALHNKITKGANIMKTTKEVKTTKTSQPAKPSTAKGKAVKVPQKANQAATTVKKELSPPPAEIKITKTGTKVLTKEQLAAKERMGVKKKEKVVNKYPKHMAVYEAINICCKKGATSKIIAAKIIELFEEKTGSHNDKVNNAMHQALYPLVKFGVLELKDGVYTIAK